MSAKTSVATPMRTGMVSTSRRMRYLSIEMETLHQFCEALTAEAQRGGRAPAMPGRSRERRADESLFEFEPRAGDSCEVAWQPGQSPGICDAHHPARRHRDDGAVSTF
jgi:hypothetical protein